MISQSHFFVSFVPFVVNLPHGFFAFCGVAIFRACIPNPNRHTDRMNTTSFPATCPFVTPADQLARAQNIAGAVRFSALAPQKVPWLWPDRIPLGRITLLVSDPGLGKSLLTLDIAARVSTGAPWPDANDEA